MILVESSPQFSIIYTRKNKIVAAPTEPLDNVSTIQSSTTESATNLTPPVDHIVLNIPTTAKPILLSRNQHPPTRYAN